MFFLVLSFELIRTKNLKTVFVVLLGILLGSAPFIMFQYAETGDPFYHLSKDKNLAEEYKKNNPEYPTFLHYLFNPFSQFPEPSLLNVYIFLTLLFCYLQYKDREREYLIFGIWFLLGYALLELHPLIPPIQRYLLLLEFPIVVLAAAQLSKIKNKLLFLLILLACFFLTFWQLEGFAPYFTESAATYEEYFADVLTVIPKKDTYIMHNNQIPYLTYYLGYTYNYSGLFGYKGSANYTFYDLHDIASLTDLKKDTYIIIYHDLTRGATDFNNYYKDRNQTLGYITFDELTQHAATWDFIYELHDVENPQEIFVSVWYIPPESETFEKSMGNETIQ